MKLKENDLIKCIFCIFIVITLLLIIVELNKTLTEGMCNDCIISPNVGTKTEFNYLGNIFSDCAQFSSSDTSYVFCPWKKGNGPSNGIECSSNTVFGYPTTENLNNPINRALGGDLSYCCDYNNFYSNNYITDMCANSDVFDVKQYGLLFDVSINKDIDLGSSGVDEQAPGTNFDPDVHLISYKFTLNNSDISFNNNRYYYTTKNTELKELSQDNSGYLNQYINCSGNIDDISISAFTDVEDCNKSKIPIDLIHQNTWCWQPINWKNCEASNVNIDCSLLYLPNHGYGPGLSPDIPQASPYSQYQISSNVQTQLNSAVDQLVSQFTQQINSITSSIGNSLQFPNLGPTQYLDVGACDNNSPYVYNSGCDTSLGYLQQYTCYPSITGAFSDCGPPAYEPKPQFY